MKYVLLKKTKTKKATCAGCFFDNENVGCAAVGLNCMDGSTNFIFKRVSTKIKFSELFSLWKKK